MTISHHAAQPPHPPRGLVEGLELDQQLVDDAGDALPAAALAHPGPGGPDGVDLLDEADGPALLPGGLAQRGEEGPDLPVGLAVEHRLEGRGRHEEKRHPGLSGQGLGQMGLARTRGSLEEDGLAGCPAHLGTEGGVGQKQVEGADSLLDHDGHPFYIVEGDIDLLRPVADVRRAAGGEQRHHHDRRHQDDQGDQRQDLALAVGQVGGAEQVTGEHRHPQPDADEAP